MKTLVSGQGDRVSIFAAIVELSGPVWPALFGVAIGVVAWLELNR